MLRAARLLLVGSAAAAIGSIVFIMSRAEAPSPLLFAFTGAAVLLAGAAITLEPDPRRGRLLAAAGALALGGAGTLAGFGAGEVTFPAAALGVLAAWSAATYRSPRWVALAFAAYLAVGLALTAGRLQALAASPFLLPSVVLWPLSAAFFVPGIGGLFAIYAALGLAVALAFAAYARPTAFAAPPKWRSVARDALVAGLAFVAFEAALALARPSTSARDELVPLAVAAMFAAAAILALGVRLLRAGVPGGLAATVLGATAVLYVVTARPTVECTTNGAASGSGPWWLPYGGGVRSSGSGSSDGGASGRIERDDGVTITYRCDERTLVEFEIRR